MRVPASEQAAELLTVAQAAALCNLSKGVVYRLVQTGQWPALRIGRTLRIPRRWIEMWIAQHIEAWQDAHDPR